MSILIDPNAQVKVEFWAIVKKDAIRVWPVKDTAITEAGAGADLLHVEAFFREPNFKDSSELADLAMVMNGDGTVSIGFNQVKMERVCILLKSWNLKGTDGKDLPCSREMVYRLNPTIAFYLASLLEKELAIDQPTEQ